MFIGLFLCKCGGNIGKVVDLDALFLYFEKKNGIKVFQNDFLCSPEGKIYLKDVVEKEGIDMVVVAGCSPREHEETFRKVLKEVNFSPYHLYMVNLREQIEWVAESSKLATIKAIDQINAGLKRVRFQEDIKREELDCNVDVMVIGAGVSGLTASLHLAQEKRKVFLIEKDFALGGKVALLDELYPGFECASCMLEPAIDKCLHNENIKVYTGTQVEDVRGFLGNFNVKVRKKPRYVLEDVCIGCKTCSSFCPVEVDDEYAFGLNKKRKAIYMPYEGCLPHVSVLDLEACSSNGKDCSLCIENCPFGAIKFSMNESVEEINCGAILIATGIDLYKNEEINPLNGVINQFQMERMLHPNGPTSQKLQLKDGREPKSIVFAIKKESLGEKWFALKEFIKLACQVKHLYKDIELKIVLPFSIEEMEGEYKEIEELKGNGALFVKGFVEKVEDCGIKKRLLISNKSVLESEFVVIYSKSVLNDETEKLRKLFDLKLNGDGYLEEWLSKFEPNTTVKSGVFVAGAVSGLKDVKTAVKDGISAAGRILSKLEFGRKLIIEQYAAEIDRERCSCCKLCISVCPFNAIEYDEKERKVNLRREFCQGCGTCGASCPSEAIKTPHFSTIQIMNEIEGLLEDNFF